MFWVEPIPLGCPIHLTLTVTAWFKFKTWQEDSIPTKTRET